MHRKRQERFRSTTSYDNSSGCDCGLCHCRSKQEASPRERRNKREIFSGVSAAQWGGWRTEWELGSQLSFKTRLPRWLLVPSWWLFHHHLSLTFENLCFLPFKVEGHESQVYVSKDWSWESFFGGFVGILSSTTQDFPPLGSLLSCFFSLTYESGFWK